MTPTAIYIRVSTGHQVDQGSSLPSQEAAIREYAERNGYEVLPDQVYSDEGESARTADRPDFQRMMAVAKQPRPPFEAIICYESSRFARSREDAIIYKSLLRRHGIALRFAKQDFDDTIGGKLLEGIIEVIDEWYSLNLSVETLRGQKQTAEQGFATGGKPPYGLRAVKTTNQFGKQKTRWEPDPETAPIVRQICEERVAGKGLKLLAYELNERGLKAPRGGAWTHNTLYYLLSKNIDAYRGTLIFNREDNKTEGRKYKPENEWIKLENAWEPIISEDLSDSLRALHCRPGRPQERKALRDRPYILTGLAFCGECGSPLHAMKIGRKNASWHYYRCSKSMRSGEAACPLKQIPQEPLETAVLDHIKRELLNRGAIRDLLDIAQEQWEVRSSELSTRIKVTRDKMKDTQRRKDNLLKVLEEGVSIKSISERLNELEDELAMQRVDLRNMEEAETASPSSTDEDVDAWLEMMRNMLTVGESGATEALVRVLVERVDVWEDRIQIHYSFTPKPPEGDWKNPKSTTGSTDGTGFEFSQFGNTEIGRPPPVITSPQVTKRA